MKTLYWLVKREYWEHRGGFFLAPAITACVCVFIAIMSLIGLEVLGRHAGLFQLNGSDNGLNINDHLDAESLRNRGIILDKFLCLGAVIPLAVMAIVVFFYCVGSLYDDRRDRSILFWQSLPISNWKTVISKVVSASIVAPLIATVLGIIFGFALIVLCVLYAAFHGVNVWGVLLAAHPFRVTLDLIALIPLYALCALPTIGWLMLCSAWARSMPFLWALVIPLASNLIVFWLHLLGLWDLNGLWYFGHITSRLLFSVTPGNWWHFIAPTSLNGVASHNDILDALNLAQNYSALTSIEMWAEAVAGVAMIGAAIWLRRWRDDS